MGGLEETVLNASPSPNHNQMELAMAKARIGDSVRISTRSAVPLAGAVCLFCLTAAAGADIHVSGYTFEAPPAEYDYEPTRAYTVKHSNVLVAALCGKPRAGRKILGCTIDDGTGPLLILLMEGMDPELERQVLRHELAHVNFWEHD